MLCVAVATFKGHCPVTGALAAFSFEHRLPGWALSVSLCSKQSNTSVHVMIANCRIGPCILGNSMHGTRRIQSYGRTATNVLVHLRLSANPQNGFSPNPRVHRFTSLNFASPVKPYSITVNPSRKRHLSKEPFQDKSIRGQAIGYMLELVPLSQLSNKQRIGLIVGVGDEPSTRTSLLSKPNNCLNDLR
jgi:hypothetical protein